MFGFIKSFVMVDRVGVLVFAVLYRGPASLVYLSGFFRFTLNYEI